MKYRLKSRTILFPSINFLALLFIIPAIPSISAGEIETERHPLLNELENAFTSWNSNISHVAILDLQAFNYGEARYVLVGWGISEDRSFNGDL
ncbi:MAG: hypothetical protein K8S15_07840, partial [Candidatus Aegiribacteria sp.]|nr:hypothetical protein [Candidatus Aegiribacteria sp.]